MRIVNGNSEVASGTLEPPGLIKVIHNSYAQMQWAGVVHVQTSLLYNIQHSGGEAVHPTIPRIMDGGSKMAGGRLEPPRAMLR